MEEGHKFEEGLWTSLMKQRHIDCYRLAVPLSWLDIYIYLKGVRIVRQHLPYSCVDLVGDWWWRASSLPILFW